MQVLVGVTIGRVYFSPLREPGRELRPGRKRVVMESLNYRTKEFLNCPNPLICRKKRDP